MARETRTRLLEAGLELLLRHGYGDLGIQTVLAHAQVPKGSFYHFFHSKEDFALQVVDRYMETVHGGLDAALGDPAVPPLQRVRQFFEMSRDKYREEGDMGCLLGGLGQELACVSPAFQEKIESCFAEIAGRVADCLREARDRGELPGTADPDHLADLLLNCWEGAALRSRLWRDPTPLNDMLDFYFSAAVPA